MEPLSEEELDQLLREWRAPSVPESLGNKLRRQQREPWWKWWLTGTIRVPVPLTVAAALALMAMLIITVVRSSSRETVSQAESGMRPVKRMEVRIIRSGYESIQ